MDKNIKQPLTKFSLNNEIKTSFEIGQVIPFFWRDTVPGDIFRNTSNFTVRFMPLTAPVMHKLDLHAHFYFVPYRLIDKNFRDVISKPESPLVCKNLTELKIDSKRKILKEDNLLRAFGIHSSDGTLSDDAQKITSSYFLRAYQLVYNYFFRHEILDDNYIDDMTSEDLDLYGPRLLEIGLARHGMDYFMSTLPSTQYGSMVELDMDKNGTIRVDEMRLAEKLQYFKERLLTKARGRYKSYLDTFFGTSPTNLELQQPKYLGGGSQMLAVADIDQTANYSIDGNDSPLGSQAGKINNDRFGYNFKYESQEHGIILGLCWVLPRANYVQGIPREFIKQDFYSFYNPTFANLGMQETLGCELSAERKDTFGYNDRYAELKYGKDVIAGDFEKLNNWHFGIDLRAEHLSDSFVHVSTDNQPFAVQTSSDGDIMQSCKLLCYQFVCNIHDDSEENYFFFQTCVPKSVNAEEPLAFAKKCIVDYGFEVSEIKQIGFFDNVTLAHRGLVLYNQASPDDYYAFYDDSANKALSYSYPFIFVEKDLQLDAYVPLSLDKRIPANTKIVRLHYDGNTLSSGGNVISNHILMCAFNNCDALRPIPKLAKPSIML